MSTSTRTSPPASAAGVSHSAEVKTSSALDAPLTSRCPGFVLSPLTTAAFVFDADGSISRAPPPPTLHVRGHIRWRDPSWGYASSRGGSTSNPSSRKMSLDRIAARSGQTDSLGTHDCVGRGYRYCQTGLSAACGLPCDPRSRPLDCRCSPETSRFLAANNRAGEAKLGVTVKRHPSPPSRVSPGRPTASKEGRIDLSAVHNLCRQVT